MEFIGSALTHAPYKNAQPAVEMLLNLPVVKNESVDDAGTKEAISSDSGEKS